MPVTRLQTVLRSRAGKPRTEAAIKSALLLADGALGAAGHEVTDPQTRDLARSVAAGDITGDEAIRRLEAVEHAQ